MAAPAVAYESGWLPSSDLAANADADAAVERDLVARVRSQGALRYTLASICAWLVERRAWERLGYARLSDYAAEQLGRSARTLQDLAHVGVALRPLPALREALVSGSLGWTKVRLLARVARPDDERRWIAFARSVSAEWLSKEVRRVDRGGVESGGLEADENPAIGVEVACTREVSGLWREACSAARKVAGAWLNPSACTELIVAEVLSALPLDAAQVEAEAAPPSEPAPLSPPASSTGGTRRFQFCRARGRSHAGDGARWPELRCAEPGAEGGLDPLPALRLPGVAPAPRAAAVAALPHDLARLLRGVQDADAFALDARLREALSLEQRLCAGFGPLLFHLFQRGVHRALHFRTREAYTRERLGLDPSWCRLLLRIERAAQCSPSFGHAYRGGALTALQASALVPLVLAEMTESQVAGWVAWAGEVSLRRLREDVDRALALCAAEPEAWMRGGGLPRGATIPGEAPAEPSAAGAEPTSTPRDGCGSTSASCDDPGGSSPSPSEWAACAPETDREIGARTTGSAESTSVRMFVENEVAVLFRATLCTVRRHLERRTGRLPSAGEALGAMAAHVLEAWNAKDPTRRRRQRDDAIHARDGWRCAVPGCSSMRNLHAHHIEFRSHGGSDDPSNLVSLCVFHHQRGVHAGTVRCSGRAPHGLTFGLGLRGGRALVEYGPGERRRVWPVFSSHTKACSAFKRIVTQVAPSRQ